MNDQTERIEAIADDLNRLASALSYDVIARYVRTVDRPMLTKAWDLALLRKVYLDLTTDSNESRMVIR